MLGLAAAAPVLAVVFTFTTRSFRVDRFVRSVAGSVEPGGKALTKPGYMTSSAA